MGCLSETEKAENPETKKMTKIKPYDGKEQQGVHELKKNYVINNKTKVLGAGQFGRVFMTWRVKDENSKVAIKVLDKHKL